MNRAAPSRFFCAICTDQILGEQPRREPLGRGGALVNVCESCHTEPARAKTGPELGYQGSEPGTGTSSNETRKRLTKLANAMRPKVRARPSEIRKRTLGWILVRVDRRCQDGTARDMHEALRTLETEPWLGLLRYLGSDSCWFLFERPGAAPRQIESVNPLVWLEPFRVTHKLVEPEDELKRGRR